MATLALPFVTSIFKPHTSHLSFFHSGCRNPFGLCKTLYHLHRYCRQFYHHHFNTTVSAITTSAVQQHSCSTDSKSAPKKPSALTFQQAIQRLQEYWASVGCAIMQCSNTEVGAGTMNPLTYLKVLGPEPWNVAYVEPSIRPDDSRYGENPNRLQRHTQFQMEAMSRGKLLSKVVEAYSHPTRIVRGKDVDADVEIDEAAFEMNEERALWSTFLTVKDRIYPGIEVDDFVETSSQLLQPLEDFFDHVFVMVEEERIRKNRLSLLKKIADLPRGIADLSVLPGF